MYFKIFIVVILYLFFNAHSIIYLKVIKVLWEKLWSFILLSDFDNPPCCDFINLTCYLIYHANSPSVLL